MMTVKICVGSSCHLKGSYDIIEALKSFIEEYGIQDKIELKASFCLGNCINGVAIVRDEMLIHKVNKDNAKEVFLQQILPLVKEE